MRPLLLLALTASTAFALDQLDLPAAGQWYAPLLPRPDIRLGLGGGAETPAAVRDQDHELRREGFFAAVAGRVWHGEQTEAWLRATAVEVDLSGGAQLPTTGDLPARLQDLRIGGFWRWVAEDSTTIGLDGEISSPSDDPYANRSVLGIGATAFSRFPVGGGVADGASVRPSDSWLIFLRYDTTQTLVPGVPLPGFAYQLMRPGLFATIGLPYATVDWKPVDDWSLSAGYFPIDAGNLVLAWSPGTSADSFRPGPGGPWSTLAGLSVAYENWYRAERTDEDLRLTFRTIQTYLAEEWRPFPGNKIRLSLGRILLREVYEADSWSNRSENRFRADPSWYGSLTLNLGY